MSLNLLSRDLHNSLIETNNPREIITKIKIIIIKINSFLLREMHLNKITMDSTISRAISPIIAAIYSTMVIAKSTLQCNHQKTITAIEATKKMNFITTAPIISVKINTTIASLTFTLEVNISTKLIAF